MKRLPILFVATVGFFAVPSGASIPDQVPVGQYFEDAELVAYVEIEAGVAHRVGGDFCGARYTANVIRAFKGEPGAVIEFAEGPSASKIAIGERYLVFASIENGFDRRKETLLTGMPEEFLRKCKTSERYLRPQLLIGEELDEPAKPSFLIPERIVLFPDKLSKASRQCDVPRDRVLELQYVERDGALAHLQVLSEEGAGRKNQ